MIKKARIIITFECNRRCHGCCNTYKTIMSSAQPLKNNNQLKDYDEILLTGGEPMLNHYFTWDIIKKYKKIASKAKIFLYTALCDNITHMKDILDVVDGIHFTVHKEATLKDIHDFQDFQNLIKEYPEKSFRLYVDKDLSYFLKKRMEILPFVWSRIEIKPWLSEQELLNLQPNGLPPNESLFIL